MKLSTTLHQPILANLKAAGRPMRRLSRIFKHMAAALTATASTLAQVVDILTARPRPVLIPLLVHVPQKSHGPLNRYVRR